MTGASEFGHHLSGRLRRLDGRLGIDHSGRSEWIWAVPAAILLATLGGFIVIGQITGMSAIVAAPIGAVIAVVMAGLAVAYMTPVADDAAAGPHPGRGGDDIPLGSPGGPWVVLAHLPAPLDPAVDDAPAPEVLAAAPPLVGAIR
jgi:hypothetical protein